jgi:hypothetical protein
VADDPGATCQGGSYSGNLGGNAHASPPQQVGAELSKTADLVRQIRDLKGKLGLTPAAGREFAAHVTCLEDELKKPAPDPGRMTGLLGSIRIVCDGAAGTLIAAGTVSLVGSIHF